MTVSDVDVRLQDDAADSPGSIGVGDLMFHSLSQEVAGSYIATLAARSDAGRVVTPNLDIVRLCKRYTELVPLVTAADVVLADGAPIVLASRLLGTPLPGRVAGSSVMWQLVDEAHRRGWRIAIAGGSAGVATAAGSQIAEAYPGLVCNAFELSFDLGTSEVEEFAQRLREGDYRIVFLGLGFPRQEILGERLLKLGVASWFVGIGAGVEFAAQTKRRAPMLWQNLGIEWLFRLLQEPRRLFRRYVIDGMPFALHLIASSAISRMRRQVP